MKTINTTPKVSIIGAGPGDAELLTIKAVRALEKADVVLYDALVGAEIKQYAPESAQWVFVGKRANKHTYSQDEINQLIVDYAFSYTNVVRLKGGDPYIFGRGHEEFNYISSFGIEVDVVPGISSAIAVPELANIPLTKRNVSQSFWVLTATDKRGNLTEDIKLASATNATVVVLMGIKKLPQIVDLYRANGKENLPVAIIQNGSLQSSKTVIGKVSSIQELAKKERIGTPGIIVLGEVVKEAVQQVAELASVNLKNVPYENQ